VKCDGVQPCTSCLQDSQPCLYQRAVGRISEQEQRPTAVFLNFDGDNDEHCRADAQIGDQRDGANYLSPASVTVDTDIPGQPETMQTSDLDAREANIDPLQGVDEYWSGSMDLDAGAFWPFSTSWQWAHEELYLQNNDALLSLDGTNAVDYNLHHGLSYDSSSLPQPGSTASAALMFDVPHPGTANGESLTNGHPQGPLQSLSDTVAELVRQAVRKDGDGQWGFWSFRLSQIMELPSSGDETIEKREFLDRLIDQFFIHFHPLWPFVPARGNDTTPWHPLLFLTLSSIGALYSGPTAAAKYGSLMHAKLRVALLDYPIKSDDPEKEVLDIGRAMLLTQVAALYFEQEGAFSAAEQLGARLNAHAHRMRLFTLKKQSCRSNSRAIAEQDAGMIEGRRMLAYGMLRAETYMSVFFNRKPMLSYEEIDLPLPVAQQVQPGNGAARGVRAVQDLPCNGLLFSDLVRIALDVDEPLPLLRPVHLELLIFGLQNDVWRFCHDPEIFIRLIQRNDPETTGNIASNTTSRQQAAAADPLNQSNRKMAKLASDRTSLFAALEKWTQAMSQSQLLFPVDDFRSAYLSGMILLKLSLLRLSAPVDAVLQIAYQAHDLSTVDASIHEHVVAWLASPKVHDAVTHSRAIWLLLSAETSRSGLQQAKYNILALIALHIAAAVTWAVAGTNVQPDACFLESQNASDLTLQRENTKSLMLLFSDLYPKITFSWGMQSSFSKIVGRLADHSFPTLQD
jgi:hypothetical protein